MIRDPAFAKIIKTGPGTKVIDLGRKGWGKFGIPSAGPMDILAFRWVNHILRNPENSAVLEVQQPGLVLNFEAPTLIGLAGAQAEIKLNGVQKNSGCLLEIPAESELKIGGFDKGSILYLGIKQGIQSESKLGSKSFFEGITEQIQFSNGDKFMYFTNQEIPTFKARANPVFSTSYQDKTHIRVYPGPEWDLLQKEMQDQLLNHTFLITPFKNRMGAQIDSPFKNEYSSIATAAVFPGTVQLTPSGKLMILLQDAQVTGGYPRILQLEENDLPAFNQLKTGHEFRFELQSFT
ncbi:5-oxoprolinase subunit C family protein [Algoriphagus hitonicola]|uniref:Biotin-dependent carboxylase uncharacterized domain-containing protein n=1 Tax=Algoriphagus hitonicola TaxID=435880 RepID=A0A1I2XAX5_9BACT|nr:biotin-dependent carboxyltransferase family protein [Algoriphagus hitonicola]SFH10690.1 biotin-dependent carboxylase uncharacterized domain-containing protein [Algoriphagus hitonicola]